jgi:hypothetical protein
MDDVNLLFVDSKNRDLTLYPSGNSYTLHLTTPIRNITRVDIVSATIPNSSYNLTTTANVVINNASNVSLVPGYYDSTTFCNEFNNSNQSSVKVTYSSAEGRFIFYGATLSTLSTTSSELAKIIGMTSGTSFLASSQPVYSANTLYTGKSLIKSSNVVDLSTNDYVWLDIDELRTPTTVDAKRIINTPLSNVVGETPISTTVTALVPASTFITTTTAFDVFPISVATSIVFPVVSVAGLETGMLVQLSAPVLNGALRITNINANNVTVSCDQQNFKGLQNGTQFKACKTTASIQIANVNGYVVGNQVVDPNLSGQAIITGIVGSNVNIQYDPQPFPVLPIGSTFSAVTGQTTSFQTYQGSTAASSFAMIHMDVPSGSIKTFKEKTDYVISNYYPSRVDKLSRLTIRWLDINGFPIAFNGLENNCFTLRIHSTRQVPEAQRPMTLPPPVEMGSGVPRNQKLIAAAAIIILILGLLIIVFYKPIVADDV